MNLRHIFAVALVAATGLLAQRVVEPLGETTEPNMTLFVLTIAPGASMPARTHNAAAFAYVIEGDVESRVGSNPAVSLTLGTLFREKRGEPVRILRNRNAGAPAKVLILQNSPSLPQGAKLLLQTTLTDLADLDVTANKIVTTPTDPPTRPHQHPGPTFAYLWKGLVQSQIDADKPETFRAGDAFFEVPTRVHSAYVNLSKTESAELLLFVVAKRGLANTPAPAK